MYVIITGGDGDIAQAIKDVLKEEHEILTPSKSELNVMKEDSVKRYFNGHKCDILINNAGYIIPEKILESDSDIWKKHLLINLFGVYLCSKYAISKGCKQIIQIGSSAAGYGKSSWSAYCASKSGAVRINESLKNEGIKSVCISPGRTKTKMRKRLFPEEDESTLMTPYEFALVVKDTIKDIDKYNGMELLIQKKDKSVVRYHRKTIIEEIL